MSNPISRPEEVGGVTKEQLTNHYIQQLERLPHFNGGVPAPGSRNDLLSAGQRCYVADIVYQPSMFSLKNAVVRYFFHCPNPEEGLAWLVLPAFQKWQSGRDPQGFPKIVANRPTRITTISLKTYSDIWKTAAKYGALHVGPDVCPYVFVLAKHDTNGGLDLLSKEAVEELKAFH